MDRKKPSLTSPWKVGFLVALLLVVTAIGVSYFITGTFGVTWHWVHFGGLHPSTWTFNLGAFIEEMAPLLLLTGLLAFGAHVLVVGAVRRYKSSVVSGVDYKQLLKSIKSVEDLEDEAVTDQLRQHPELREFLMSVKHRLSVLERQNGERDRKHNDGGAAPVPDQRPRLQSECALLASAVANGRDAFSHELALTVPELKQIERAVRESFAKAPEPNAVLPPASPAKDEAEELRVAVRTTAASMRRDVEDCGSQARDLEASLAGLCKALQAGPSSAPAADVASVQERVDATAEALAALGEETKRIAIAAALQASGGPEADTIKFAEELRALATKFNTLARHWRETAPALKQAMGSSARSGTDKGLVDAAATAVKRARLWSERAIAMNEHIRTLEQAVNMGDLPVDRFTDTPVSSTVSLDEEEPVSPLGVDAQALDVAENRNAAAPADMFGADEDDSTPFTDIPGFEKEHRFFADTPAKDDEPADERFEVDGADERQWDLERDADEAVSAEKPQTEPAPESATDSDGFLTGPRRVVSSKKVERPAAPAAQQAVAPKAEAETQAATATMDPDADAIDLYELGAIDCVQTT